MGFWSRFRKRLRNQERSEAQQLVSINDVKAAEQVVDMVLENEEGKTFTKNTKGVWVKDQTINSNEYGEGSVILEHEVTSNWTSVDLDWSSKGTYDIIKIFMNGRPMGCYRIHGHIYMNGVKKTSGYTFASQGRFANDGTPRSYGHDKSYIYITDHSGYYIRNNETNKTVGAEITLYRQPTSGGGAAFQHKSSYQADTYNGGYMIGGGAILDGAGSPTGIQIGTNEGTMGHTRFTVIGYNKIG